VAAPQPWLHREPAEWPLAWRQRRQVPRCARCIHFCRHGRVPIFHVRDSFPIEGLSVRPCHELGEGLPSKVPALSYPLGRRWVAFLRTLDVSKVTQVRGHARV
jgi:hypothetical protein